jgi:hypothetical protein
MRKDSEVRNRYAGDNQINLEDHEEEDFEDTFDENLPEGLDRKDPIYRKAYTDVLRERLHRVDEEVAKKPLRISGQSAPYRPELTRSRRWLSKFSIVFIIVSALLYLASFWVVAACAGVLGILSALGLAASLLAEVLFGSGLDEQSQYIGTDGPFREYSFRPSIRNPTLLFALLGNVIASVVLGYAEVYAAFARERLLTFSKPLDFISSAYFSLVTFATVGYGDFYPENSSAKLLVCSEVIVALFILAIVLATSTSWMLSRSEQIASERRSTNAREMQRVENVMKGASIGLYQNDEQLFKAIRTRMDELKRAHESDP